MTERTWLLIWLVCTMISGCTSLDSPSGAADSGRSEPAAARRLAHARTPDIAADATPVTSPAMAGSVIASHEGVDSTADTLPADGNAAGSADAPAKKLANPLQIEQPGQTGQVENPALDEISGLAVSRQMPGVLFAVNDSGNAPELYAMSETGADLGHWRVNARNHDWEDMATTTIEGKNYLVLGDTGDNLQVRQQSVLYLLEEPSLDTPASTVLEPARTLRFRYEDGPRNVEALAIEDNIMYLISKEAVGPAGTRASRLYTLMVPDKATDEILMAQFAGELPMAQSGLEARLAAAVAGVDLNHPTALDFDTASNTAYLLTYRHVVRINRRVGQSWIEALTSPAERIHSHSLWQAEALAVSAGQSIWLTSENTTAPIWALPIRPPS